ncbi:Tyrosine recombinase XerC [subsurface metagenome]
MNTSPKTLTVEECDNLLEYLVNKSKGGAGWRYAVRTYTMAVLMLDAGLRVGELVRLELRDLYFQEKPVKTLIIRSQIAKRKRERSVPMSIRAQNSLRLYAHNIPWLMSQAVNNYAFRIFSRSEHLSTRQVERAIRAAAMKAIGRPVHPHILRHTFASRLMRVTDSRTVQELLGHKNLSSTQVYTHPNEDDKKKAIERAIDYPHGLHGFGDNSPRLSDVANGINACRTNHDQ